MEAAYPAPPHKEGLESPRENVNDQSLSSKLVIICKRRFPVLYSWVEKFILEPPNTCSLLIISSQFNVANSECILFKVLPYCIIYSLLKTL